MLAGAAQSCLAAVEDVSAMARFRTIRAFVPQQDVMCQFAVKLPDNPAYVPALIIGAKPQARAHPAISGGGPVGRASARGNLPALLTSDGNKCRRVACDVPTGIGKT